MIHQDGKYYEPTGEVRAPKMEWYLEATSGHLLYGWSYCTYPIYREVTEPSPDAGAGPSDPRNIPPAESHDTGGDSPKWYGPIRKLFGWAQWKRLSPNRREFLNRLHGAWLEIHGKQESAELAKLREENAALKLRIEKMLKCPPGCQCD